MSNELKVLPCPWCGNTPDISNDATFQLTDGVKYGALTCCGTGPEVRTGYMDVPHWKADAIEAWNDRAATSGAASGEVVVPELEQPDNEGSYSASQMRHSYMEGYAAWHPPAEQSAPPVPRVGGLRYIPDSECKQSRCACPTTGCLGECSLKRSHGVTILATQSASTAPRTIVCDEFHSLIDMWSREYEKCMAKGNCTDQCPKRCESKTIAWRELVEFINGELNAASTAPEDRPTWRGMGLGTYAEFQADSERRAKSLAAIAAEADSTAPGQADERAAFENAYEEITVDDAWRVWQARDRSAIAALSKEKP